MNKMENTNLMNIFNSYIYILQSVSKANVGGQFPRSRLFLNNFLSIREKLLIRYFFGTFYSLLILKFSDITSRYLSFIIHWFRRLSTSEDILQCFNLSTIAYIWRKQVLVKLLLFHLQQVFFCYIDTIKYE